MTAPDVDGWFVREVLPLEAALLRFLRRSRRTQTDVEDLCHDVYVRIYEAAQREIPDPVRPFVFTVARNLLLNRARHENVVAIEAVADLDSLGVALDKPGPDRTVIARQELHRFQLALDRLPPRDLVPGDVVIATANTVSSEKKGTQTLTNELGWRRGVLVFHDTALADVAEELNRYNTQKIVIADAEVARLTIGATIPTHGVEAFTRVARDVFGLRIQNHNGEIVISR